MFSKISKKRKEMIIKKRTELFNSVLSGQALPVHGQEIKSVFVEDGKLYAKVRITTEEFKSIINRLTELLVDDSVELQNLKLGVGMSSTPRQQIESRQVLQEQQEQEVQENEPINKVIQQKNAWLSMHS